MDLDTMKQRWNEPDQIDDHLDVDRLVDAGVRRGRRTQLRHRLAGGAVAGVALLALGGVVISTLPTATAPMNPAQPASPSAPKSPSPTSPSTSTGFPTEKQIAQAVLSRMPSGITVTNITTDPDTLTPAIYFRMKDSAGWAHGIAEIGNQEWPEFDIETLCGQYCTQKEVAGQRLYISRSSPDDKVGNPEFFYLLRSDGRYVLFMQHNSNSGNGPLTRPTNPLSEAQVEAILTAPAWDALSASMPNGRTPKQIAFDKSETLPTKRPS